MSQKVLCLIRETIGMDNDVWKFIIWLEEDKDLIIACLLSGISIGDILRSNELCLDGLLIMKDCQFVNYVRYLQIKYCDLSELELLKLEISDHDLAGHRNKLENIIWDLDRTLCLHRQE